MVNCLKCGEKFKLPQINTGKEEQCALCGVSARVDVYPALSKKPSVQSRSEFLEADDKAGCFFHPQKKAVVTCSSCGRFLCGLCDIEMDGKHLCPKCLDTAASNDKDVSLAHRLMLYDNIALFLSLVLLMFSFMAFITVPIIFYIIIRYWKTPLSLTGRTRIRFIIAGFIALLHPLIFYLMFFV